jgi:hypothetical protein
VGEFERETGLEGEPGTTKVGVPGRLSPDPPIMDPDEVFGLEPSLEDGLEKLWPKVGGGSTGAVASSLRETCC